MIHEDTSTRDFHSALSHVQDLQGQRGGGRESLYNLYVHSLEELLFSCGDWLPVRRIPLQSHVGTLQVPNR
jgi:hypothetical protein